VKKDGTLWAWGFNDDGQLGLGVTGYRLAPTLVTDWSP
jgi:alpha-tubulin suppressor-like RCC1 family protein